MKLMPHQITDAQRYIQDRSKPTASGCWEWQQSRDTHGYPQSTFKGRKITGNRLSYAAFKGSITFKVVRHTCDNRACVNPDHLILGSEADNSADMVERERQAYGERNGSANLSAEQAIAILKDSRTCREIAADYGVWKGTVSAIKTGRTWSKITGVRFNG